MQRGASRCVASRSRTCVDLRSHGNVATEEQTYETKVQERIVFLVLPSVSCVVWNGDTPAPFSLQRAFRLSISRLAFSEWQSEIL